MADFVADTAIEPIAGEPDRYRAVLSPKWAVWGPNGGYLAAIALRAAMARSRAPRPASFQCHFLAVGEFAPVEPGYDLRIGDGPAFPGFPLSITLPYGAEYAGVVLRIDNPPRASP